MRRIPRSASGVRARRRAHLAVPILGILLVTACTVPPDSSATDGSQDRAAPRPSSAGPVASPSPDVATTIEPLTFARAAPVRAAAVAAGSADDPGLGEAADSEWVARTAVPTRIPERALRAYAGATIVSEREDPGCRMSWNLLAALGQVESRHGEISGGRLDASGLAVPDIIGVPLDGDGVAAISDTDDGLLDGDAAVDRAVGPMQFIPGTWRSWSADGDGDGGKNPQDIDDAAAAAVQYLCRTGRDLGEPEGWATAVRAWNRSEAYLWAIATWAERYRADAAEVDASG